MDNLTIIQNTDPRVVAASLSREGISDIFATNGVFAGPAHILLPTNLAYFKMMDDTQQSGAFFIGVNSDESVALLNQDKKARGENIPESIPQETRVNMVGKAVAALFPTRDVVIGLYDTRTPVELYETLQGADLGMRAIFKGNYGTKKGAGKIEGSHCFDRVIASPLPHATEHILPYAAMITDPADEEEIARYEIGKLTEDFVQQNGRPYMSEANKLMFPVPQALQQLCDQSFKLPRRENKF